MSRSTLEKHSRRQMNNNSMLLIITIALFALMYTAGCIAYSDKGFDHFQTFLNILINNSGLICVACGMTCVMLTGGIDISVGALIAMDCMFLAVGIETRGVPAMMKEMRAAGFDEIVAEAQAQTQR